MRAFADLVDRLDTRLGRAIAWATLALVVLQFAIVVARYVFGVGTVWAQEAVIYLFAGLMTLTAGWALAADAHVRVDLFYRGASSRAKALIDLAGVLVFLVPMCAVVLWTAWPYAAQSWAVLEGSKETSGIPAVFVLKSLIVAFAGIVLVQGVAMAARALASLRGEAESAEPPAPAGAAEPPPVL